VARIAELLRKGRTFSFEFFPPKNDAEAELLASTLRDLEPLEPSFVSVTYRGGRSSRERTLALVGRILASTSLTPMAHLICVAHTRAELVEILHELRAQGVENLMALGGDPPADPTEGPGELVHAIELVELARSVGGFSIGVAAHPAGHPRSPDLRTDRRYLAAKLELADFAITQFFFEAHEYVRLVSELAELGVEKPVLPGIMPVTSLRSVPRMAEMGAPVPAWLAQRLEAVGSDPEAVRREGIDQAVALCSELLAKGAPGLHFYTLNRSSATREIYAALGLGPGGVTLPADGRPAGGSASRSR
jgi:methylenetetrahydrofolate reductase (NADPH)